MHLVLTSAGVAAPLEVGADSGLPPTPGSTDIQRLSIVSTNITATNDGVPIAPGAPRSAIPVPKLATRPYEGDAA